mmetsp:Transcript_96493/g.249493  ORF Transcript_96493/g.249493 Transcript_96493/m.249493 type:complete len:492 (+) Transcript_96493:1212-2687(+)
MVGLGVLALVSDVVDNHHRACIHVGLVLLVLVGKVHRDQPCLPVVGNEQDLLSVCLAIELQDERGLEGREREQREAEEVVGVLAAWRPVDALGALVAMVLHEDVVAGPALAVLLVLDPELHLVLAAAEPDVGAAGPDAVLDEAVHRRHHHGPVASHGELVPVGAGHHRQAAGLRPRVALRANDDNWGLEVTRAVPHGPVIILIQRVQLLSELHHLLRIVDQLVQRRQAGEAVHALAHLRELARWHVVEVRPALIRRVGSAAIVLGAVLHRGVLVRLLRLGCPALRVQHHGAWHVVVVGVVEDLEVLAVHGDLDLDGAIPDAVLPAEVPIAASLVTHVLVLQRRRGTCALRADGDGGRPLRVHALGRLQQQALCGVPVAQLGRATHYADSLTEVRLGMPEGEADYHLLRRRQQLLRRLGLCLVYYRHDHWLQLHRLSLLHRHWLSLLHRRGLLDHWLGLLCRLDLPQFLHRLHLLHGLSLLHLRLLHRLRLL